MSAEFRNPIHYQRLNDAVMLSPPARRSVETVARIIKDLHADFVMQGVFRYYPCVDTCSRWLRWNAPKREKCIEKQYAYDLMARAVDVVQSETDAIIGGGTPIEFFWAEQWDSEIEFNKWLSREDVWKLALDPRKFGLPVTKEKFQAWFWKRFTGKTVSNPKKEMDFYLYDPTQSDVQNMLADILEAQLRCGVKAFWWDMLLLPVAALLYYGVPVEHTAIAEVYNACKQIAKGTQRKARHISWSYWQLEHSYRLFSRYGALPLDICVVMITTKEVKNKKMDDKRWNYIQGIVKKLYRDTPIFARIDYGKGRSPLYVFAEELSMAEANAFLEIAENFLRKRNVHLILPVHGGNPCDPQQIKRGRCPRLAFGKYNWYDSLAPEWRTYPVIKAIAYKRVCRKVCRTIYEQKCKVVPVRVCRTIRTIVPVRVRRTTIVPVQRRVCRTVRIPVRQRVCRIVRVPVRRVICRYHPRLRRRICWTRTVLVPRRVCRTEYRWVTRRVCRTERRWVTRRVYRTEHRWVTRRVCRTEKKRICRKVPKKVCKIVCR